MNVVVFIQLNRKYKMLVLEFTFMMLAISGCFRPLSWTSLFKRTVYNVYRIYIITLIYTCTISCFMDIMMNVNNPDDVTGNLYMTLTEAVAGYKVLIMWVNYAKFVTLIKYLAEEPFKPLDTDEMEIQQKFDKIIRANSLRYCILVVTSCSIMALASLLTDFRHRELTYRGWVPYNDSSYGLFCLTYTYQILNTYHSAVINIGCDNLICGFLMCVCCQIDILQYRLKKTSRNQDTLGYCIRHHNHIFEFAQLVNTRFREIIGLQFMTSTLVICCILYLMTKSELSEDHIPLILYTCCMMTEIFIYCWFGNKVKLKSLQLVDSIFQMDWLTLDDSLKKSFLIIMRRAMIPIQFSSAHIVTMDLDSFVGLLKLSYSTYSLLAHMKE